LHKAHAGEISGQKVSGRFVAHRPHQRVKEGSFLSSVLAISYGFYEVEQYQSKNRNKYDRQRKRTEFYEIKTKVQTDQQSWDQPKDEFAHMTVMPPFLSLSYDPKSSKSVPTPMRRWVLSKNR